VGLHRSEDTTSPVDRKRGKGTLVVPRGPRQRGAPPAQTDWVGRHPAVPSLSKASAPYTTSAWRRSKWSSRPVRPGQASAISGDGFHGSQPGPCACERKARRSAPCRVTTTRNRGSRVLDAGAEAARRGMAAWYPFADTHTGPSLRFSVGPGPTSDTQPTVVRSSLFRVQAIRGIAEQLSNVADELELLGSNGPAS
jgi:hypothetical protein